MACEGALSSLRASPFIVLRVNVTIQVWRCDGGSLPLLQSPRDRPVSGRPVPAPTIRHIARPLRNAARAVVVDQSYRLLLVRFEGQGGPLWFTPGGGVEDGETTEDAIRRELREEVGLNDVDLGPLIWQRTHVFPMLKTEFDGQHEVFYLVRTSKPGTDPTLSEEDLRAEGVTGSRWWTLAELRAAQHERFAPTKLPELFEALINRGPPDEVIDAGV
jgi:ADP-ribose pyrophosphatase YjhB (NUDIX family)